MRNKPEGFSLIELMIVVVIIGVLAAIAIGSYVKYVQSAKTSEVSAAVGAIKSGEESYYVETGMYLALPRNPSTLPHAKKETFTYVTVRASNPDNYDTWGPGGVSVKPDLTVYFRYVVEAGAGATASPTCQLDTSAQTCSQPRTGGAPVVGLDKERSWSNLNLSSSPNDDWFVIQAVSDLDGNVSGDSCSLSNPDFNQWNCSFFESAWDRSILNQQAVPH
jgi:type IV pilus assembly protein PilA